LITTFFVKPVWALEKQPLDKLILTFMHTHHVTGMSIAVLDHDQTHYFNYGYANEEKKIPTSNHTVYTIASFTKTFTATLAAIAAAEGQLDLAAPITHYFPLINRNKALANITTSELLCHVAGLPFDFQPRPQTKTELITALNHFAPSDLPGTQYSYSNAGIGTVGYLLENIYADNYTNILNKKLLQPLGMHSTYLNVPITAQKNLALGHDKNNQPVTYNPKLEVWFAAASLKSNIVDMATYVHFHMTLGQQTNKTLMHAALLVHLNRYCFSNQLACEQLSWQAHGLSELNQDEGDTYFSHFDEHDFPIFVKQAVVTQDTLANQPNFIDKTGSGYGMSSYMAYLSEKRIGVVILTNKFLGNERIHLGREILRQLS
jgi:beta-lactamase class C